MPLREIGRRADSCRPAAIHFILRWLTLLLGSACLGGTAFAAVPPIDTSDWPARAIRRGDPFSYQIRAPGAPTSYDATGPGLVEGLSINRTTGVISGTPVRDGGGQLTLRATNADGTATANVMLSVQYPPRLVAGSGGWSATAMINAFFSYRWDIDAPWNATGTEPGFPSGFRVSGLPPGVAWPGGFARDISGQPTAAGTFPITITAYNDVGESTATLNLTVLSEPPGPPVIQNTSIPPTSYNADRGNTESVWFGELWIEATNFPTSFAISNFPARIVSPAGGNVVRYELNTAVPGLHQVMLSATNSKGTGSKVIPWSVHPRLMEMTFSPAGPYRFGDTIRVEAKFNSGVVVTGSPYVTAARLRLAYASGSGSDTLVFTYRATEADYFPTPLDLVNGIQLNGGTIAHPTGPSAECLIIAPRLQTWRSTTAGIYRPRPVVTSAGSATAEVGRPFTFNLTATNQPDHFAVAGGSALPAGLTLNASTGVISGTPQQTGTHAVQLVVGNAGTDANGFTTTTLNLTIATAAPPSTTPPPPATTPPPPVATTPPPPTTTPPPPNTTTPPPPVVTTPPPPPSTLPPASSTLAPQTIEFVSPVSNPIMGQPFLLGATSSANLPITYSVVSGSGRIEGNALIVTGPGPVVVRAAQPGTGTIAPASAEVTITGALRAAQTIAFNAPTAKRSDDAPFTLNATASSGLPVTFSVVSGPATLAGNTLTLSGAAGTVVVRATQAGNDTTAPAEVTVSFAVAAPPASRFVNVSARLAVDDADPQRTLIAGFVLAGDQPQRVLVRAAGPSLAAFGVTNALANPRLRVFDATGRVVAENDDWAGADTLAAGTAAGAFAWREGSADAAVLATLPPGAYSAQVLAHGGAGTALVEIYDANAASAPAARPALINLSTRGHVGAGDEVVAVGFVISGDAPKRVLVRGVGPALTAFGVTGALADPALTIHRGASVVAQNDDWAAGADINAAAAASGAFALPAGSKDAAVVLTLPPGGYTALVRGAAGATGVALVEVYELPAAK